MNFHGEEFAAPRYSAAHSMFTGKLEKRTKKSPEVMHFPGKIP
jgi:hypothetical protein